MWGEGGVKPPADSEEKEDGGKIPKMTRKIP
jgi:hypothetical protein